MCDHIKQKLISNSTKQCIDCLQEFCTHPKIDYDSTCLVCGCYVVEISIEQNWTDSGYNKNAASCLIKNTKDHVRHLESLGYASDIIEAAMDKFTKIGCSLTEETAVVAVCIWLTWWDLNTPRTMIEIAKKHGLTKSKIKEGRRIVLSCDFFKEYRVKYISVSSMIKKLVNDLGITDQRHYNNIYKLALFIEKNWDKLTCTKRSAPQNIASACVFLYVVHSPTLNHMVSTSAKKKNFCKSCGPSSITIEKIAKLIETEMIKIQP